MSGWIELTTVLLNNASWSQHNNPFRSTGCSLLRFQMELFVLDRLLDMIIDTLGRFLLVIIQAERLNPVRQNALLNLVIHCIQAVPEIVLNTLCLSLVVTDWFSQLLMLNVSGALLASWFDFALIWPRFKMLCNKSKY